MIDHLRKCLLCSFLVIVLALQAGLSFGREQTPPEPIRLKVLLLPFLSYSPLFIANEEGFFAEQRLQVEFVKMDSSAMAIPSLAQGDLDVVAGSLRINTLNAIIRDGKIKFVADKGHISPTGCTYYGFIARRALMESGELRSPAQLKGKTICLATGWASSEGYFVEGLLNMGGVNLSEVKILEHIPFAAELEAMNKGSIDLSIGGEPKLTQMIESNYGVLWMPVQQVIPDFQFDVVAFGPTVLVKRPEAGKRFMVAYLKAVRQYNQGKSIKNLSILTKHTSLEVDFLKKVCWPQFRSDGTINVKSILDFQSWAVRKGLLDTPCTENQFWDPSFIEYANKVLGASKK